MGRGARAWKRQAGGTEVYGRATAVAQRHNWAARLRHVRALLCTERPLRADGICAKVVATSGTAVETASDEGGPL